MLVDELVALEKRKLDPWYAHEGLRTDVHGVEEWTTEVMDDPTWFWQLEQIRRGAPARSSPSGSYSASSASATILASGRPSTCASS